MYIVCKTFKAKGIDGYFNIKRNTNIPVVNGYLTYNNRRICHINSQTCWEYFAINDDGLGIKRYNLIREVINKSQQIESENQKILSQLEEDSEIPDLPHLSFNPKETDIAVLEELVK